MVTIIFFFLIYSQYKQYQTTYNANSTTNNTYIANGTGDIYGTINISTTDKSFIFTKLLKTLTTTKNTNIIANITNILFLNYTIFGFFGWSTLHTHNLFLSFFLSSFIYLYFTPARFIYCYLFIYLFIYLVWLL